MTNTATPTRFTTWLATFIDEKNINTDQAIEVDGPSGPNHMTVGIVLEAINGAPAAEQAAIKTTLVKIDFCNGDVVHFLTHLAQALAI